MVLKAKDKSPIALVTGKTSDQLRVENRKVCNMRAGERAGRIILSGSLGHSY